MKLSTIKSLNCVCAIGGGHGLGRVLTSIRFLEDKLNAIVTTSDNGGSTGKIRKEHGGIAWGDLRNCLMQINHKPSLIADVFEYRFKGDGALNGHNLGNLILYAMQDMELSPQEILKLTSRLLQVKTNLIPMSETPVHLNAKLKNGEQINGEVDVDKLKTMPEKLYLSPKVNACPNAINKIIESELIILGPGSFFTSIIPPLLIDQISEAIKKSQACIVFIDNLVTEQSIAGSLTLDEKVMWLEQAIGINKINYILTQSHNLENTKYANKVRIKTLSSQETPWRHDLKMLAVALDQIITEHKTKNILTN